MKKTLFAILILLVGSCSMAMAQGYLGKAMEDKWEYRIDAFYSHTAWTKCKIYDQALGLNVTLAYDFNDMFSTGFSTGLMHDFGRAEGYANGDVIPLLGDVQYRYNPNDIFNYFLEARAGLLWGGMTNSRSVDHSYTNYAMYEVNLGAILKVNEKLDLRISLGYANAKDIKFKKFDEDYLILKFGIARRFTKIRL